MRLVSASIILMTGVTRYLIILQETNILEAIPGTSALLEVQTIESLVQYFQTIINTHLYTIMNSEEFRLERKDLTVMNSETEKKTTALVNNAVL